KQQLRELIRQNYNHPSVCFWGLFDEPNDTITNGELLAQLDSVANSEDSTRPSVLASDVSPQASVNFETDVMAFNKYFGWYYGKVDGLGKFLDAAHAAAPNRAIGLSEYGAGGSVYQHADPAPRPNPAGPFHPEEYQDLV